MKKLFAGCVAVSFAAMLAACGDDSSSTSPDTSGNESSSSEEDVSSSGKAPSSSEAAPASSSSAPSSSVTSSESLPLVSGGVWPKFLWDGSTDKVGQVVTGSDEKTAGIWYDFNDRNDGGSSKFTFPPEYYEHTYYCPCFDIVFENYGGFKGTVELGAGADNPYVGLGFNTLNEDQDGADISEWGGLCLEYSSELNFVVKIHVEDGIIMKGCDFIASIGASESKKVVDIPWDRFGQSCGWGGKAFDVDTVLANAAAVHLLFEGKAGDTGDFLLTKIGSLGQCNSGSVPAP